MLAWVVELLKLNYSLRKKNMTQVGFEPTRPEPPGHPNPSSASTFQPLRSRVKHPPESIYLHSDHVTVLLNPFVNANIAIYAIIVNTPLTCIYKAVLLLNSSI